MLFCSNDCKEEMPAKARIVFKGFRCLVFKGFRFLVRSCFERRVGLLLVAHVGPNLGSCI